ncbi:MAG: hypothetical protein IKD37_07240 [Clostridia bacterium]|nr:hypothetical protein [Clostridia bacterium]
MLISAFSIRMCTLLLASMMLTGCNGTNAPLPDETTAAPTETTAPSDTTGSADATRASETAAPAEPKPYAPVTIEMPEDPNLLYNGIRLPEVWPPENISPKTFSEIDVPYLKTAEEGGTHPGTVDIDVGRQLFVDNFLIEKTDLTAAQHKAVEADCNPVLSYSGSTYRTKHGGFFYNAEKQLFEHFWNSGNKLMYISSKDGITWDPDSAYPVLTYPQASGAYASVVLNETPDENNPRYVCVVRYSNGSWEKILGPDKDHEHYNTIVYYSDNGQTWKKLTDLGPTSGDATSFIYNPFRQTYIFSLRRSYSNINRARDYIEVTDILNYNDFTSLEPVFWLRADSKDLRDPTQPGFKPEVYSISAVAYESIMLGAFQVYLGPSNSDSNLTAIPKITNINLGFSRDGFYYSRPFREPIIESSKEADTWDRGYLHHVNNVCVIVGDELRFYYSGYRGDQTLAGDKNSTRGCMSNCSLGYATMRRDGFVSMDGSGELLTRLLRFDEVNDRLFINAKAKSLRAEILDADGNVIPGFSLNECVPFSGDSTCAELTFENGANLGELRGTEFRIRFIAEEAEFYAFWVSDTEDGESGGFLAGGYLAQ